jgi:hypothetical protein
MAENRLCMTAKKESDVFTPAEIIFFTDAASMLAADVFFFF